MGSADREDRVALVTGGSRGIGRAVTEALLGEGWQVHFCSRSRASMASAAEELGERWAGRVQGEAVDVRDEAAIEGFVQRVAERAGRLDCLINNAGIGHFAPVDEITGEAWRRVIEINLSGAFYALAAAARVMKARGSGWIVNIASLAGKNPFAGGAAYNASKFGLMGLSDAAMLDLRQHGIRVTAIMPGSVDTDFFSRSSDGSWKLAAEDVARTVLDLLRYPDRALPSRVELRPSRPPQR